MQQLACRYEIVYHNPIDGLDCKSSLAIMVANVKLTHVNYVAYLQYSEFTENTANSFISHPHCILAMLRVIPVSVCYRPELIISAHY